MRAAISKALIPAALPGLAKGSSFALSLSDRSGFNGDTPFSVRSLLPEYDDCSFLCAVWDKEALVKEYNMKIMAEPVVHESANKDLLAGRALQWLTVIHSVFAHVREGCGLPVVAEAVCMSAVSQTLRVCACLSRLLV